MKHRRFDRLSIRWSFADKARNLCEKALQFVEVPRRCTCAWRTLLTLPPYGDGKASPLRRGTLGAAVATTNFKDRTRVCSVAKIGIHTIEQTRQEGLTESVVIRRERILQDDYCTTCGALGCSQRPGNQCGGLAPELSLRGRYECVGDNFMKPCIRKETAHAITEQRWAWPMRRKVGAWD